MSTYARFWSVVAVAVAAMGLAAVVFSQGLALTSIALAFAGSLGAFVHWGRLDRSTPDLTSAMETGAATGIAVVGSLGFGLWLGGPGFLAVLVLAVLSVPGRDVEPARSSAPPVARSRALRTATSGSRPSRSRRALSVTGTLRDHPDLELATRVGAA